MLNPALIWVNILEVVLIVAFLAIIRYFEEKMRCWSPSGWGKFFVGGILPLYVAIFFITLAGLVLRYLMLISLLMQYFL
jgi:hypothetical protein